MSKEGQKRKKGKGRLSCPLSFSSYIIIFSASVRLVQGRDMSKKRYSRVFWSLVFLRQPLPSFSVQIKLWFTWESVTSPCCPWPWLLHTSLGLIWNLAEFLCIVVSWEFCAHRVLQTPNMNEQQGLHLLSTCLCSIASYNFACKIQLQKYNYYEFQDGNNRALNQGWGLSESGSCGTAQVTCPWSLSCWSVKIVYTILWLAKWNTLFQTWSEPLLCLCASQSANVVENTAYPIFRSEKNGQNFWTQNLKWVFLFPAKVIGFAILHSRDE